MGTPSPPTWKTTRDFSSRYCEVMAPQIKPLQGRERAPGWQPWCEQGLCPPHAHHCPRHTGVSLQVPRCPPPGTGGQGEVLALKQGLELPHPRVTWGTPHWDQ